MSTSVVKQYRLLERTAEGQYQLEGTKKVVRENMKIPNSQLNGDGGLLDPKRATSSGDLYEILTEETKEYLAQSATELATRQQNRERRELSKGLQVSDLLKAATGNTVSNEAPAPAAPAPAAPAPAAPAPAAPAPAAPAPAEGENGSEGVGNSDKTKSLPSVRHQCDAISAATTLGQVNEIVGDDTRPRVLEVAENKRKTFEA